MISWACNGAVDSHDGDSGDEATPNETNDASTGLRDALADAVAPSAGDFSPPRDDLLETLVASRRTPKFRAASMVSQITTWGDVIFDARSRWTDFSVHARLSGQDEEVGNKKQCLRRACEDHVS